MYQQLVRSLRHIERFVSRPWYVPLVALMAAVDIFILVIPLDAFLISAAAVRPRRWIYVAVTVTLGSALGALSMAVFIRYFGQNSLSAFFIARIGPEAWKSTEVFFEKYGGWTYFGFAAGPFPLAPGAIVGAATKSISLKTLFIGTFLGRLVKFSLFSWAATHSPRLLNKMFKPKIPKSVPLDPPAKDV